MTATFVITIRIRGGDERLELITYAGSLKDAKYIRDSYRAAGLEAPDNDQARRDVPVQGG